MIGTGETCLKCTWEKAIKIIFYLPTLELKYVNGS